MLIRYILKGLAGDDVLLFTFGHYHSTPQDRGGSHFEGRTQRKAAYSSPDWILAVFGQREGGMCVLDGGGRIRSLDPSPGPGAKVWSMAEWGSPFTFSQDPNGNSMTGKGLEDGGVGWARWVEGLSRYRPLTGGEPAEGWQPF